MLLPCPFCGGEASVSTYEDESLWSHNIVKKTIVSCDDCDISFESEPNSEFQAEVLWNRRVKQTVNREHREAVHWAISQSCVGGETKTTTLLRDVYDILATKL